MLVFREKSNFNFSNADFHEIVGASTSSTVDCGREELFGEITA